MGGVKRSWWILRLHNIVWARTVCVCCIAVDQKCYVIGLVRPSVIWLIEPYIAYDWDLYICMYVEYKYIYIAYMHMYIYIFTYILVRTCEKTYELYSFIQYSTNCILDQAMEKASEF